MVTEHPVIRELAGISKPPGAGLNGPDVITPWQLTEYVPEEMLEIVPKIVTTVEIIKPIAGSACVGITPIVQGRCYKQNLPFWVVPFLGIVAICKECLVRKSLP